MKSLCVLVIVGAVFPGASLRAQAPAVDQDTTARRQYWVNAGLGIDLEADYIGAGIGVSVMRTPTHFVTARVTYLEEFQLCIFGPCSAPPDYRAELGVLYGLAAQSRWMLVSASAGVGVITGRTAVYGEGGPREQNFTTAGLPVEIQLYLRPFAHGGVGATAIGNLNSRDPFVGIIVGIQFRPAAATLGGLAKR